jgi:hypothetical protein
MNKEVAKQTLIPNNDDAQINKEDMNNPTETTAIKEKVEIEKISRASKERKVERYIKEYIPPRIDEAKTTRNPSKEIILNIFKKDEIPMPNFPTCPTLKEDKYVQHNKNLLKNTPSSFSLKEKNIFNII